MNIVHFDVTTPLHDTGALRCQVTTSWSHATLMHTLHFMFTPYFNAAKPLHGFMLLQC